MKKNNYLMNLDNALFQSVLFYIILAILLLPFYQYQINPDGISYISIAQKYIHQDYNNAINGYWSPLLSWLLIPFLILGFKPLLTVKLLSLTIGVTTIIQSNLLIKTLNIKGSLRFVVLYLIAIIIIYFALIVITPDLLFVCLGLGFINSILNPSYVNYKYAGLISGLLGSGLYLAKSFGFPFFLASFIIVNLIFYFRSENEQIKAIIFKKFILGIIVFTLISTCWISIISIKYGYLTIGTSGSYNHAISGPESIGNPMSYKGLIAPPNNNAISAWEDISYVKIQSWNIFDSYSSLNYYLKKIIKNILDIYKILNSFSLLSIIILNLTFVYLIKKGKRFVFDNIFILMVIIAILNFGYSLLFVLDRYIWLNNIIILIVGAKLLELLFRLFSLKRIPKILIVCFFAASFSLPTLRPLYLGLNNGVGVLNLNSEIRNLNIHGRIASTGHWKLSLYLSFYNDWSYYGHSFKPNESELKTELENKKIDYYFVWKPFEKKIKFIENYEELTNGKTDMVRIYKLR